MTRYESDCVGCPQGCIGDSCKYRHVPYTYCDKCGAEADKVYTGSVDYDELCRACAEEEMRNNLDGFDFFDLCELFDFREVNAEL